MGTRKKSYKQLKRQLKNLKIPKEDKINELKKIKFLLENDNYIYPIAKDIKEFIISSDYLNAKSECWNTIIDILTEFYESKKHIGVFIMPPGTGKSYLSSIIATYEMHKLLCLKNPQERLKLAKGSNIAIMNMSQNGSQAKKVVFGEIKARIDNSPWFNMYCRPNPDKKSELEFRNNCFIIPGNSSETNPFGYNLVVAIMDEVAWWETTAEHDPVRNAFETLEKRFDNRYKDNYEWKIVLITNPSYPDAFVETLERRQDVFFVRKPVWEVKPEQYGKKMINWNDYLIPKELEGEAKLNPDIFKRDRLSVPSETITAWLVNKDILRELIMNDLKNPANAKEILWDKIPIVNQPCFMHVDLAVSGDACGVAIVYKENNKIKPLLLYRIKGSKEMPVLFSDIRQIPVVLRNKKIYVKRITYDGFQSVDSIQILRNYGFNAEKLSVDTNSECYDSLREMMYNRKVVLPDIDWSRIERDMIESPEEWLVKELRGLERHKNKVDHKPKGSKDVADAFCGAVYSAIIDNSGGMNNFEYIGAGLVESANIGASAI